MSTESLQARWPGPEAPLNEHVNMILEGLAIVEDQIVTPEDNRLQLAYSLLLTGRGQKSSVEALGDGGTGKTTFGDLLFGSDNRVEMAKDDTDETLYGYPSPFGGGQYIPGKMRGLTQKGNPTAWMNEVAHMPNTGPLHRLWDADRIFVNGETCDIADIAIYLARNFPDGGRNYDSDDQFNGRKTGQILTGDLGVESATKLQGDKAGQVRGRNLAPILPIAAVRRRMNEEVVKRYPIIEGGGGLLGSYVVAVVGALNESDFITPISDNDGRIAESLLDTARANRFLEEVSPGKDKEAPLAKDEGLEFVDRQIVPEDYARVAAFTLPTNIQLRLNHHANDILQEELQRRPTNLEKAILTRRLIARVAFTELVDGFVTLTGDSDEARKKFIDANVAKYTYANVNAIKLDVDKVLDQSLAAKSGKDAEEQENKRYAKSFQRYSPSRRTTK